MKRKDLDSPLFERLELKMNSTFTKWLAFYLASCFLAISFEEIHSAIQAILIVHEAPVTYLEKC